MIEYIVFVPLGYLLGGVPFGLIAGKLLGGVDIRDHGSGNTGTANVMRTVNPAVAVLVLVLDMTKAAAIVLAAKYFAADEYAVHALAAIAAVVGHNWSPFMRFSGGKGTAAGWGGLLALSPIAGIVASVVGVGVVALTRYVSLGSMIAAGLGSVVLAVMALMGVHLMGAHPIPYAFYGAAGAPIIIWKHRDNIKRLLDGSERKLGHKIDDAPPQAGARQGKGLRWPRSA